MKYKRIMIFGCPGSGKSTLAVKLFQKLNIPVYHADKHYYSHNWIPRDTSEFFDIMCSIAAQNAYIIDGNLAKMMLERDVPVDLVIYLDVPLWKCYWRVIRRYLSGKMAIDDRAPGCEEALRWPFLKSLWMYRGKQEPRIELCKKKYPKTTFVHIHNEDELETFIKQIQ